MNQPQLTTAELRAINARRVLRDAEHGRHVSAERLAWAHGELEALGLAEAPRAAAARAEPRNRSDIASIETDLSTALKTLRSKLYLPEGSEQEIAMCEVETFCAVAIRVMRKTNPSKLRSEARTVELKARLDGIPVVRGAA